MSVGAIYYWNVSLSHIKKKNWVNIHFKQSLPSSYSTSFFCILLICFFNYQEQKRQYANMQNDKTSDKYNPA